MKRLFDGGKPGDVWAQSAVTRTRKRNMIFIAVPAILLYQACLSLFGWYTPLNLRWRLRTWQNAPNTSESQHGQAEFDWLEVTPTKQLHLRPCYDGLQCGVLELPLDYWNDSTSKTIGLAIARVPAKVPITDPRWGGAVVVNPGGPGGSGTMLLQFAGAALRDIVDAPDRYYDIVSFDPRGVGRSKPGAHCFEDSSARQSWTLRIVNEGILDSSDAALGRLFSMHHAFGASCALNGTGHEREIMQYISTASVARDMLELVERFGEWREKEAAQSLQYSSVSERNDRLRAFEHKPGQEQLQYWGFSYGTFLGSTFASMYPDRIERMILDGVVYPPDYLHTRWTESLHDTEKTMESFYELCAFAGPSACALANDSSTPADIKARVDRIVSGLYHNPLPLQLSVPDVVTYSDVKMIIFAALYNPVLAFRPLAHLLAAIERKELTTPFPAFHSCACNALCSRKDNRTRTAPDDGEAQMAIACGDGDSQDGYNVTFFEQYWRDLDRRSPTAGAHWAGIRLMCSGWKIRPKYRYTGPYAGNTSFPILWIGNTADPVTPVYGAHKLARRFKDSVVLTQDCPGHCSVAAFSLCTVTALRAYLHDGVLPPYGTVCPVDQFPFGLSVSAQPRLTAEELRIAAAHADVGRAFAKGNFGFGMRSAGRIPADLIVENFEQDVLLA